MRFGLWLFGLLALACAQPVHAQKRIAFSFDDSPRFAGPFLSVADRQKRIIAGLKRAKVRQAAFFVNPGKLADPSDRKQAWQITGYAKAGHAIANHSDTHPMLSQSAASDFLADVDKAESWLKGREGRRPWFRFPYLDEGRQDKPKRDAIREGLKSRRLHNGYVTVDSSDWLMADLWIEAEKAEKDVPRNALRDFYVQHHVDAANFYDALARQTLGRSPAHVLLLHETDLAAYFIADLVDALRKDGWKIISADAAYADPVAKLMPDTPSAQGTLTEALAWEKGIPAPRWYKFNNAALLRADFAEKVLKEPTP